MESVNPNFIAEITSLAEQTNFVYAVETTSGLNPTGRFRRVPGRTQLSFYDREIRGLLGATDRMKNALTNAGMTRVGHLYVWPDEHMQKWIQERTYKPNKKFEGDIEYRLLGIEGFGVHSLRNLAQVLTGNEDTAALNNLKHSTWQNVFLIGY